MNKNEEKEIKDVINQQIGAVTLSESEKTDMLQRINFVINEQKIADAQNKPTPWQYMTRYQKIAAWGLASAIFISTGSGVIFASAKSLPGDILYPIKTEIIEEIVYRLTPIENRLAYTEKLIDTRIAEVQTVQKTKRVDADSLNEVEHLLVEHTDRFDTDIKQVTDQKIKVKKKLRNIAKLESYENLSEDILSETNNEPTENLSSEPSATTTDVIEEVISITSTTTESTELDIKIEEIHDEVIADIEQLHTDVTIDEYQQLIDEISDSDTTTDTTIDTILEEFLEDNDSAR